MATWTFAPIGTVRTSAAEKPAAPRQASESAIEGELDLTSYPQAEDALAGLEAFSHVWVLYVFHHNLDFTKAKVSPPRSDQKVGVLATRSPHRPNPLGLSLVEIVEIRDRRVRVRGVDMLDGTPILDLKPYLPYADVAPAASHGWLESPGAHDPGPRFSVEIEPQARAICEWFTARTGFDVIERLETVLATGPRAHAYRRIRTREDGASELAVKSLRFGFRVEGRVIRVLSVTSGFRPAQLAGLSTTKLGGHPLDDLALHRERFGLDGGRHAT
jgi:tRNA-Thr(GGU) m(6)t(6)A37 methyltransferase TsaA